MGVPLVDKMLGSPSEYRMEDNERYKQIDEFVKDRHGQMKHTVGPNKGAAVIDVWMENHF